MPDDVRRARFGWPSAMVRLDWTVPAKPCEAKLCEAARSTAARPRSTAPSGTVGAGSVGRMSPSSGPAHRVPSSDELAPVSAKATRPCRTGREIARPVLVASRQLDTSVGASGGELESPTVAVATPPEGAE